MQQHLTILELEQARLGEAEVEQQRHLEACADCRAQLTELRDLAGQAVAASPVVEVPAAIEQQMRDLAAQHARRVRRFHAQARRPRGVMAVLRWAGPAVAAAVVALWVGVPVMHRGAEAPAARLQGDVNADGRLDIVDALLLARALEEGGALHSGWDFDGDRRVDRADVDALARQAVALGGGQP